MSDLLSLENIVKRIILGDFKQNASPFSSQCSSAILTHNIISDFAKIIEAWYGTKGLQTNTSANSNSIIRSIQSSLSANNSDDAMGASDEHTKLLQLALMYQQIPLQWQFLLTSEPPPMMVGTSELVAADVPRPLSLTKEKVPKNKATLLSCGWSYHIGTWNEAVNFLNMFPLDRDDDFRSSCNNSASDARRAYGCRLIPSSLWSLARLPQVVLLSMVCVARALSFLVDSPSLHQCIMQLASLEQLLNNHDRYCQNMAGTMESTDGFESSDNSRRSSGLDPYCCVDKKTKKTLKYVKCHLIKALERIASGLRVRVQLLYSSVLLAPRINTQQSDVLSVTTITGAPNTPSNKTPDSFDNSCSSGSQRILSKLRGTTRKKVYVMPPLLSSTRFDSYNCSAISEGARDLTERISAVASVMRQQFSNFIIGIVINGAVIYQRAKAHGTTPRCSWRKNRFVASSWTDDDDVLSRESMSNYVWCELYPFQLDEGGGGVLRPTTMSEAATRTALATVLWNVTEMRNKQESFAFYDDLTGVQFIYIPVNVPANPFIFVAKAQCVEAPTRETLASLREDGHRHHTTQAKNILHGMHQALIELEYVWGIPSTVAVNDQY